MLDSEIRGGQLCYSHRTGKYALIFAISHAIQTVYDSLHAIGTVLVVYYIYLFGSSLDCIAQLIYYGVMQSRLSLSQRSISGPSRLHCTKSAVVIFSNAIETVAITKFWDRLDCITKSSHVQVAS